MSQLNVDNIRNRTGANGGPTFPQGITVSAGATATISGDLKVDGTQTIVNTETLEVGDKNIGIASTNPKGNDASIDGAGITIYSSGGDKTLTWNNSNQRLQTSTNLGVTGNVNVSGVSTLSGGIRIGTGGTVGPAASGVVTYYGDGSNLTGVVSGIEVKSDGSSVGTSLTALNFSGATVSTGSAGITTITIAAAGITTSLSTPGANTVVSLNLSTAQHHQVTLTAGVTTFTCSGGSFGDSHSLVIIQPSSGITTVGFSTYFLWPSGSAPNLSRGSASSEIDLVSFVVKQVAVGATQLLASAGLDYQ